MYKLLVVRPDARYYLLLEILYTVISSFAVTDDIDRFLHSDVSDDSIGTRHCTRKSTEI